MPEKTKKYGIRTHEAVIVTFFYLQTDRIPLQPEQASCTATFNNISGTELLTAVDRLPLREALQ